MKAFLSIVAASLLLVSCTKDSIRGSGPTITETRSLQNFTGIRVEGSGKVTVAQGAQQKVEVTGYANLVPIYRTIVSNGVLVVKFDNDYWVRNSNVTVNVVVPVLAYSSINGSGDKLKAQIQGSGEINYWGQPTQVDTEINGSGKVNKKS